MPASLGSWFWRVLDLDLEMGQFEPSSAMKCYDITSTYFDVARS